MTRHSPPPVVLSQRHDAGARGQGVTAVLGPTNTGKTHYAIERMLGHASGLIGLPLRLLAREVYGRVVARVGADAVALITGEEKIKPPRARYWIATAEAMPLDLKVDFVALDEIQLAADMDRGHIFTGRLLNCRGRVETLLIGAATMRPLVERLIPGVTVVTRPRLSQLTFAGEKKLTRLPPRCAIVAFSAGEVYAIAELIRRQKGGAAVVMGALSPRTRNAQVELYQSGEVDYLIATDAVGMGLNLDVDHVAFAAAAKFDGTRQRLLTPAEIGQIAGRAGRHMRDGTFGSTGRCPPFDEELVREVEEHAFAPLTLLQWRNPALDVSSIAALQASLAVQPREAGLVRAPMADDEMALDIAVRDPEVRQLARGLTATGVLWRVAQVPDYRKVAPTAHAELVVTLFRHLMERRHIPDDWFQRQIAQVDRTDGDIDTLSARIAQVRTWTFVANRSDWLSDPEHWQGVARQVEDRLSDALHERLALRFVDRRTSVLMRRLKENVMLEAEITQTGDVKVEGQHVGALHGFLFVPDAGASADSQEGRALRAAAAKGLAGEFEARAERFSNAVDESILLSNDGTIRWLGEPVARLSVGDKALQPRAILLADEQLAGAARDKVEARLANWIKAHIARLLGPLLVLEDAPAEVTGMARGIAFQMSEALGILERSKVAEDMKGLDQPSRAALRGLGVRFGAYHLYLPALMKPAPRALACRLWALKHGTPDQRGLDDIPHLASSGRTSIPVDKEIARDLYRAGGFRVCGERAVRVDILERLADLIRPAIAYRPGVTAGEPPAGTADQDGFVITVAMTSLVGCSGEDFASILKSLGYVLDRRPGPAITKPLVPAASMSPAIVMTAASIAAAVEAEAVAEGEASVAQGGTSPDAEVTEAVVETTQTDDAAASYAGELSGAPESVDGKLDVVSQDVASPVSEDAAATTTDSYPEPEPEPSSEAAASVEMHVSEPAHSDATVPDAPIDIAADIVDDAKSDTSGAALSDIPVQASDEPSAEAVDEAAPEVAAEPVLIEVWRPHRHHGGQRGPRHGQRGGAEARGRREGAAPGGPRPDGEGRREGAGRSRPFADRAQGDRAQGDRTQGDRPQGDRPQGGWPRADSPRPEGAPNAGELRQEARPFAGRPQGDRPQRDRFQGIGGPRPAAGERPAGERPAGGRPSGDKPRGEGRPGGFGGRPERDGGRKGAGGPGGRRDERRDRGPGVWSSDSAGDKPRGNKAVDPDSPFAKLAALKAQLEGKSRLETTPAKEEPKD